MDKNAYAKGWWDAMVKKRDPQGVVYTWSEPPAIPVSEISRLLILAKKELRNKRPGCGALACTQLVLRIIRDKLELRRRSRVQKNIRGICQVDSGSKQRDIGVRYEWRSTRRHEKQCAAPAKRNSQRTRSGSTSTNNARSSAHQALRKDSNKRSRTNAK